MSGNSRIEWTEATWNPVTGCTHVSPGCDHCYAASMTRRLEAMGLPKYVGLTIRQKPAAVERGIARWHFNGMVRCHDDMLDLPLRTRKPTRWFVNSMSDLFHEAVPREFIVKVLAIAALTPHHTYQILTKRPNRMADELNDGMAAAIYRQVGRWLDHLDGDPLGSGALWDQAHRLAEFRASGQLVPNGIEWTYPLPNVWFGTSAENQTELKRRVGWLLRCPAAVRWLSVEPMLGPVDLSPFRIGWWRCPECGEADDPSSELPLGPLEGCRSCEYGGDIPIDGHHLHWVVCGGESGPGARPMHPNWPRSLRDQCVKAGVPLFFKQWGAWAPAESQQAATDAARTGRLDWVDVSGERGFAIGSETRAPMIRVGKKAAGRLLDGRTWDEYPEPH